MSNALAHLYLNSPRKQSQMLQPQSPLLVIGRAVFFNRRG